MAETRDERGTGLSLPRPAPRRVLADEVYEILREGLLSRRIEPGARLNLDLLARELHVSNTPVRQALARLEADGLVTKEPYVGFTASPLLDSRTVDELYDLRLLIEPAGAGRAAKRDLRDGTARLADLCDRAERMLSEQPAAHVEALGNADAEFHLAVADAAGNRVILGYLGQVLTQMSRYTLYASSHAAHRAWAEHRTILEAIERGDADAAHQAMRAHLRNGLDRAHEAVA